MSEVQFCVRECGNLAVGVGRWEGRRVKNPFPPRPRDLCRQHLIELVEPDLVRCEVIDRFSVIDFKTLESVAKPGVVWLDPCETNIAILVATGIVKVLPRDDDPAPAAEPPPAEPVSTAKAAKG
jgi:hypothetical protein